MTDIEDKRPKLFNLKSVVGKKINLALDRFGYNLVRNNQYYDMDKDFFEIYEFCRPYAYGSIERMFSLYKSVEYIIKNNIKGDFVECGVASGGSTMLIALTLKKLGVLNRKIYLYDTFTGMTKPTKYDKKASTQEPASKFWKVGERKGYNEWICFSLEEVKLNMARTNYPGKSLVFVKGKVEDTLKTNLPKSISLLRLDTDFYESTKIELQKLYPLLNNGGVLIIDDYGHWLGARKAVDEYFKDKPLLFNRVDYTGRTAVKVGK